MAETLSVISLISFLAAGVFAILAVVLWFVFHIPTVAGELSGRTAKKSIERTRRNNEEASKNSRGAGPVRDRGKNFPADGRQAGKNSSADERQAGKNSPADGRQAGKSSSADERQAGKNSPVDERQAGKNSPADERQTRKNRSERGGVETALRAESAAGTRRRETAQQSRETARRSRETAQQSRETEVLADTGSLEATGGGNPQRRMSAVKIELLEEILFIHTKEVIE